MVGSLALAGEEKRPIKNLWSQEPKQLMIHPKRSSSISDHRGTCPYKMERFCLKWNKSTENLNIKLNSAILIHQRWTKVKWNTFIIEHPCSTIERDPSMEPYWHVRWQLRTTLSFKVDPTKAPATGRGWIEGWRIFGVR